MPGKQGELVIKDKLVTELIVDGDQCMQMTAATTLGRVAEV